MKLLHYNNPQPAVSSAYATFEVTHDDTDRELVDAAYQAVSETPGSTVGHRVKRNGYNSQGQLTATVTIYKD